MWTYPTSSPYVTDTFNPKRKHPKYGTVWPHTGADFRAPMGTPILAASDGVVERTGYDPPRSDGGTGAGYHVRINHGGGITTRYYHLAASGRPIQGASVRAGQQVGASGNTGDSTAAHLHFEVRVNNTPVDPVPWLLARVGASLTGYSITFRGPLPLPSLTLPDSLTPEDDVIDDADITRIAEKVTAYLLNYRNPVTRPSVYALLIEAATGAPADVDEVELAAQLAPLLRSAVSSVDDGELEAIATAVADETDRRARERLAGAVSKAETN